MNKQGKKLIHHIVHCAPSKLEGSERTNDIYLDFVQSSVNYEKANERNEMQNIHIKEMNACYFQKSHIVYSI